MWKDIFDNLDKVATAMKQSGKKHCDCISRPRTPLKLNQKVRVQNEKRRKMGLNRYNCWQGKKQRFDIKLPSGKVLWRNRPFITPVPSSAYALTSGKEPENVLSDVAVLLSSKKNKRSKIVPPRKSRKAQIQPLTS